MTGASTGTGAETGAGAETGTGTETTGSRAVFECPYCDGRFARERYRDLHLGQTHPDRLDAAEREAYDAARDEERADLRMFRLKALAVLVLVYFGFLVVYALTL